MWNSNNNKNRLFPVVVVLQLSLCMSNYRWITTTTLHSNINNQKTNYHQKYWTIYADVYVCCCCFCWYCVIVLLFICNCGCTLADEQQEQQCETVTTTTTQRDLHPHLYPLLIDQSTIVPYYTMSVWHVGECRHTHQIYPRPTLLIDQSTTVPYYTMSVSLLEECRHTYPLLIEPTTIEPDYTA